MCQEVRKALVFNKRKHVPFRKHGKCDRPDDAQNSQYHASSPRRQPRRETDHRARNHHAVQIPPREPLKDKKADRAADKSARNAAQQDPKVVRARKMISTRLMRLFGMRGRHFKSNSNLFAAASFVTVAVSSLETGLLYFTGTRSSRLAAICSLDMATASASETARLGRAAVIETLYAPIIAPGRPLVISVKCPW